MAEAPQQGGGGSAARRFVCRCTGTAAAERRRAGSYRLRIRQSPIWTTHAAGDYMLSKNTFRLNSKLVEALLMGMAYKDIHSQAFRGGVLRGELASVF